MINDKWMITREALLLIESKMKDSESNYKAFSLLGDDRGPNRLYDVIDGTAIISIHGPMTVGLGDFISWLIGATDTMQAITAVNTAVNDESVDNILLDINSPGGMVSGVSELASTIKSAGKPTTVYSTDMLASAAYWVASAADEIVLADTAKAGSIGVVTTIYVYDDPEEFEIVSTQSPNKRVDPRTEEGKAEIQRIVDELADIFISAVASNRNVSKDTVINDFGNGGVLIGAKAVSAGMADRLGTFNSTIAGLASKNEEIVMADKPDAKPETNPAITLEYLKANHADIVDSIYEQGAKAERERIQGVESQMLSGHEELINTLKFDGKTTGEQAAVKVLQAERENNKSNLDTFRNDAANNVEPSTVEGEHTKENLESLPLDEQCKAKWNKSAELRDEFMEFESYLAFVKAEANGLTKTLNK